MKDDKRSEAVKACDKVINGIEDGSLSVPSSLLLCKKIARLINDQEGQEWLNYEYGGYPTNDDGQIEADAWGIGAQHGRSYNSKDKEGNNHIFLFTDLCGELESTIENDKQAIKNFSLNGCSVSGEHSVLAIRELTNTVTGSVKGLLNKIQTTERRLSILKAQYYDYAVKWKIELGFGDTSKTIFEEYQSIIEKSSLLLPINIIQKLNAVEDIIEDGNPERYAQILTSCRRLWNDISKYLFEKVLPHYSDVLYKTRSGKEIDISGDHTNNKLIAVIETIQSKSAKNTLVGSEMIYLVDWISQITDRQCEGVHSDVTRDEALQCVIHTYIALGGILSLWNEYEMLKHSVMDMKEYI